jgi:VIT1/CCC1 family predicted Fe2+/Mn2+ transporter
LNFTARTVFAVSPTELGSPLTAATSSFALFAIGALIPLAPWFFTSGAPAVSRSSGNSTIVGATRQLAIVIFASAITFGIGSLFGTAIA